MGALWALLGAINAAFAVNSLVEADYGWAAFNGFIALYLFGAAILAER